MDVWDEDSGLIFSKFRKAKRGFSQTVSGLKTTVTTTTTSENSESAAVDSGTPTKLPSPNPNPTPAPSAFTSRESLRAHGIPQFHFQDKTPSPLSAGSRMRESIIAYGGHAIPLDSPVPPGGIFSYSLPCAHFDISNSASASPSSSGRGSIVAGTTTVTAAPDTTTPSWPIVTATSYHGEIFRFDSADRERYQCSAISEEEEVFSPGISPCSSSPHIVLDSSCLTRVSPVEGGSRNVSPLHSGSFLVLSPNPNLMDSQNRLMARVHTGLAMLPTTTVEQTRGLFGVPSSPVSPLTPNTPISPSSLFSDQAFQQGFLAELYRRRCHSDSDLPLMPESSNHEPADLTLKPIVKQGRVHARPRKPIPHPLTIPTKGGSLESDQSSPQDSPLDLSVKGNRDRFGSSASCESLTSRFISSLAIPHTPPSFSPGVTVIHGDIASPTTRNSVALRYNLDVSPVVEEMPPGADMAFVCPICGQMFSLHDRLAKHMASRHKSKPHDPNKSYPCDVCHRSFARSDMLTRHMRLHTGVKPYTCRVCGQVFSRSDHLSTHQRTHTGEKPYKCPQCPYSACRRDMITRHLRTHTRNSSSSSSDIIGSSSTTPTSTSFSRSESLHSLGDDQNRPIKMETMSPSGSPSTSSSLAPDSPSPLSPALNLNLGSLSVHSPAPIPLQIQTQTQTQTTAPVPIFWKD